MPLYPFVYNLEEKENTLRFVFDLVSKWFEENFMVLNADKCHFMCLGQDMENETFIFNIFIFNNSNEEKILGITIDNKLTFKSHIKILCRKAAEKMKALSRLLNHLSDSHKKEINFQFLNKVTVYSSQSQFTVTNYCPFKYMDVLF